MEKYKGTQLIELVIPLNGSTTFSVDSLVEVDKIRISVFDYLSVIDPAPPGLSLFTNMVDNNSASIGTVAVNYTYQETVGGVTFNNFQKQLSPEDGMEFIYENKVRLSGSYTLNVTDFNGALPDATYAGSIFLLIEYFAY